MPGFRSRAHRAACYHNRRRILHFGFEPTWQCQLEDAHTDFHNIYYRQQGRPYPMRPVRRYNVAADWNWTGLWAQGTRGWHALYRGRRNGHYVYDPDDIGVRLYIDERYVMGIR